MTKMLNNCNTIFIIILIMFLFGGLKSDRGIKDLDMLS